MKFQLLCLLYLFATVHCAVLPRDDKIGYNRRPNADEVRGKLITYWSQPPIFAQLPDEQKPQIEVPPCSLESSSLEVLANTRVRRIAENMGRFLIMIGRGNDLGSLGGGTESRTIFGKGCSSWQKSLNKRGLRRSLRRRRNEGKRTRI